MSSTAAPEIDARLLLDQSVVDDPYAFYRRLLAEAPVWRIPGSAIVVVSSFAAVSEVVNRTEDFSSNLRALLYRGPGDTPELLRFDVGVHTLATADPPAHTAHRETVFPELVARRMAALRPEVEALAREYLSRALAKPGFEVMHELANAIPIRVVSGLIGFSSADPDRLLAADFDSTDMIAATRSLEEVHAAMARTADVMSWITEQLQAAVERGGDGILGVIGVAVREGRLDLGEGLVILHTLLSAGGESTTSLLGNAIHMLALDQDLQARLRAQPALVDPFIEEALRLESPFRHHLRHVPRDRAVRSSDRRGIDHAGPVGCRQPRSCAIRPPRRDRARPTHPEASRGVRTRHPLLRRRAARAPRGAGRPR
jgi:cytochrome P450